MAGAYRVEVPGPYPAIGTCTFMAEREYKSGAERQKNPKTILQGLKKMIEGSSSWALQSHPSREKFIAFRSLEVGVRVGSGQRGFWGRGLRGVGV